MTKIILENFNKYKTFKNINILRFGIYGGKKNKTECVEGYFIKY